MKKMKLDVETLRVESMEAAPAAAGAGTVRAHAPTDPTYEMTCTGDCNTLQYGVESCWYVCP